MTHCDWRLLGLALATTMEKGVAELTEGGIE